MFTCSLPSSLVTDGRCYRGPVPISRRWRCIGSWLGPAPAGRNAAEGVPRSVGAPPDCSRVDKRQNDSPINTVYNSSCMHFVILHLDWYPRQTDRQIKRIYQKEAWFKSEKGNTFHERKCKQNQRRKRYNNLLLLLKCNVRNKEKYRYAWNIPIVIS